MEFVHVFGGEIGKGAMMIARIAAVMVLFAMAGFANAEDIAGQASVIDGDTLEIRGTRIRLWGIDAPESEQLCRGNDGLQYRCGAKSANGLDAYIAGRSVECTPAGSDRHGQTASRCKVNGADLGDWLVRSGLALDWPIYSKGEYRQAQREAEKEGRGVWAGSFIVPWVYRVCVRSGGSSVDCSDDADDD
jgi:endonuclease YncB( thermonuclease family)